MTCCNKTNLSCSDITLRSLNAINFIVADIKACHFSSLDNVYSKITCSFCITPRHPIMLGNAATWLVGSTMNRVPDIRADIDDGHQLLHFCRSKPLTVDAVEGIRIQNPARLASSEE